MKGELQNKKVLVRGKGVFVGVDVHNESWHVTTRTEGEEVFHGGIPSQYHAFRKLMDHFKDCRIKVKSSSPFPRTSSCDRHEHSFP
jgi:hypothetical protein